MTGWPSSTNEVKAPRGRAAWLRVRAKMSVTAAKSRRSPTHFSPYRCAVKRRFIAARIAGCLSYWCKMAGTVPSAALTTLTAEMR